ncbi:MAG: hypothetical protein EOO71_08850 [Myxococcaceae bacterium]|nr:MAG: hypothetical protein EOO71_08850 [Myxococcaceae bacterium]
MAPDQEQEQPRHLVLYNPRPDVGWRYAIYTEPLAVIDGRLLDCPLTASFDEARAHMERTLTELFGGSHTLRWTPDSQPGWWKGEVLAPLPPTG